MFGKPLLSERTITTELINASVPGSAKGFL
jgi:hypothetical protein